MLAETGCSVTLVAKPMLSCYTEQMKNVPRCEVDDDYAAGIFVSLYGTENLMHVQGNVHLFNKSTGQWENSERSLSRQSTPQAATGVQSWQDNTQLWGQRQQHQERC